VGGRKSPFPITLAIGIYNSLYYRASRYNSGEWRNVLENDVNENEVDDQAGGCNDKKMIYRKLSHDDYQRDKYRTDWCQRGWAIYNILVFRVAMTCGQTVNPTQSDTSTMSATVLCPACARTF